MSDHRKGLSATGLAFIAVGLVAFLVGLMGYWMNARQPIPLGMVLGIGLALSGFGLMWANREERPGPAR